MAMAIGRGADHRVTGSQNQQRSVRLKIRASSGPSRTRLPVPKITRLPEVLFLCWLADGRRRAIADRPRAQREIGEASVSGKRSTLAANDKVAIEEVRAPSARTGPDRAGSLQSSKTKMAALPSFIAGAVLIVAAVGTLFRRARQEWLTNNWGSARDKADGEVEGQEEGISNAERVREFSKRALEEPQKAGEEEAGSEERVARSAEEAWGKEGMREGLKEYHRFLRRIKTGDLS